MRVLICGSRGWDDSRVIAEIIALLPRGTVIVHGGADGADALAGIIAEVLGYATDVYPVYRADWLRDGKRAGMLRNLKMLDTKPDRVIAFWDGQSHGTKHTIGEAKKRGIPVTVVRPLQVVDAV